MTKQATTREYANKHLVQPQTVLKRLCETGSYFGVVPRKLPNGRLAWPLEVQDLEQVREGV